MSDTSSETGLDLDELREAIRCEYRAVAKEPDKGYHFHTGRRLAEIVEYRDEWLEAVPDSVLACFAGTGNPFSIGPLAPGERVVDLGCGAGIDSFIAASQVGESGTVIGLDMTTEMTEKARAARDEAGVKQLDFRQGYLESIPVEDGWADVVISNGVLNLPPDKSVTLTEWCRVLEPGGRLQIGDILVTKEVPESAKRRIDLWTG